MEKANDRVIAQRQKAKTSWNKLESERKYCIVSDSHCLLKWKVRNVELNKKFPFLHSFTKILCITLIKK